MSGEKKELYEALNAAKANCKPKEIELAQEYLASGRKVRHSYLHAYGAGNMAPRSQYTEGYKILRKPHVAAFVLSLQKMIDSEELAAWQWDKNQRILIAQEAIENSAIDQDNANVIKGLDYISKIEGDYAPVKTDNKTNIINDIDKGHNRAKNDRDSESTD